jgi:hypothetical protein
MLSESIGVVNTAMLTMNPELQNEPQKIDLQSLFVSWSCFLSTKALSFHFLSLIVFCIE